MKKQFMSTFSNVVRKTMLSLGFASFLTLSFVPSVANAQDKPAGVAITYVGTVDNQPIFQIEFENKNEDVFNISIKDDAGNVLYGEKFKDKKFSKKFKYQDAGIDDVKLTFTLTSEKEKQSQSFEINTNTRVIQDVVVTRL
jgi:hypothetical protein